MTSDIALCRSKTAQPRLYKHGPIIPKALPQPVRRRQRPDWDDHFSPTRARRVPVAPKGSEGRAAPHSPRPTARALLQEALARIQSVASPRAQPAKRQRRSMLPSAQRDTQHQSNLNSEPAQRDILHKSQQPSAQHDDQQHSSWGTGPGDCQMQPLFDSYAGPPQHSMQQKTNVMPDVPHDIQQYAASNASPSQHVRQQQHSNTGSGQHDMQQQRHTGGPPARSNLLHRIAKQIQHDLQQPGQQHTSNDLPQFRLGTRSAMQRKLSSQPHMGTHMSGHVSGHMHARQPMVRRHAFGGRPTWTRQDKGNAEHGPGHQLDQKVSQPGEATSFCLQMLLPASQSAIDT